MSRAKNDDETLPDFIKRKHPRKGEKRSWKGWLWYSVG
jgi:hypothetical protein